jgi:hypothetical protein
MWLILRALKGCCAIEEEEEETVAGQLISWC